jgi:hypothetical protein
MCQVKISKGGSNMKAQLIKMFEDLSIFRIKKSQNTLKEKGSLTSFF